MFSLFVFGQGEAQEYKVVSFEQVPTDLSARVGTTVRVDGEGKKCALLKVYVPDRIAKARGNTVGDIISEGMEKWVYLTDGSKEVELVFDQHYPLHIKFIDFDYPVLTQQFVYILKLAEVSGSNTNMAQSPIPSAPVTPTTTAPQPSEIPISSTSSSTASSGGGEVESFTVNGVTFEMMRVKGGSFMMGSEDGNSDEKPVHRENVSTFYIGKTEVTQALWKAVMGDDPSYFKGANRPVERVSWDDCQEFVDRLSRLTGKRFRLPTEAEWEYAARGGNLSWGYKYSGSDNIDRVAWYYDNSGKETHPVAQKLVDELSIYDMTGNVWEWTSDNYSDNYNSPRNSSTRVIRGGSWNDSASYCRVANRYYYSPGGRSNNLGLRLAF